MDCGRFPYVAWLSTVLLLSVMSVGVSGQTPCSTGSGCASSGNYIEINSAYYCCYGSSASLNFDGSTCTCSGGSSVTYSWQTGAWSACTASCGGGTSSRSVTCVASTGGSVSALYCSGTAEPSASQSCNTAACACSCSGCTSTFSNIPFNGQQNVVIQCNAGSGPNYIGVEVVNVQSTDRSLFRVFTRDVASPWPIYTAGSALSSTTCYKMPNSGGSWTVLADEWQFAVEVLCDTPSGCSVEYNVAGWGCYINNDPTYPGPSASVSLTTATTYSWQQATNTGCTASCGGGVVNVTYQCEDGYGHVINSPQCSSITKPAAVACNTQACITYSWQTSAWGTCTATCGGGSQTRSVSCQSSTGATVSNGYCSGSSPASLRRATRRCARTRGRREAGANAMRLVAEVSRPAP